MNLSDSFQIYALMDGTTINGILRVEGTPLSQRYNKGTDKFIPDFESLAENKRPTVVTILRDVATGGALKPTSITFKYNDVALTFGSDGLSTNSGLQGYFKKIDDYSVKVGSQTITLPVLRVMKNLVPISGYDNDRISVSGSVEVGGASATFDGLSTTVVIQESTGNSYDVQVQNDYGSQFEEGGPTSFTETAHVYKDGVDINDFQGITFKWFKVLGTGDTALGTSRTQNITLDDVDNKLKLRVDVYVDGSKVASGFDEISDFTDTYYVNFKRTGISGNTIRQGETATITPVAVKRSTGEENPSLISTWSWSIKDNSGAGFTLTGKEGATFQASSVQISYEDVKRAGYGLGGVVTGTGNSN